MIAEERRNYPLIRRRAPPFPARGKGEGAKTVLAAMITIACLLTSAPTFAVQPDEILSDPALEARARALSGGLRCLVCQNQSIDDSDAPLARDLRILIRERLVKGDSDQQVRDFAVARYGDFVLLKPRLTPATVVLWTTPVAALVIAGLFLFRRRKGTPAPAEQPLSPAEQAEFERALK